MSLSFARVVLVVAFVAVSGPVLAGGSGGTKADIPVRMKNVGSAPVAVNSASGAVSPQTLLQGTRTIASNGITQFMVKKGSFTSVAANPDNKTTVFKAQGFETRDFKTIYLIAQADATSATLTGAPAGVKF